VQERLGSGLTGFELYSDLCLSLVLEHFAGSVAPFAERHPYYVLVELSDFDSEDKAVETLETALGAALDSGLILDAALAKSLAQFESMWALRENISEAQAREGPNIKHDVSVPISRIAEFIAVTDAEMARAYSGVRMMTFGHLGDGNLHYNITPPKGGDTAQFLRNSEAINRLVHDSAARFRGSISAEHGLGQYKRGEILRYKSALEMDLMRAIKRALDPHNLMNPGKVL
jgi:FAD/FMN-containing dehydrogenase